MRADWSTLTDATQLDLASQALRAARARAAHDADSLADAFEDGSLPDRGGADALRLMAALLRHPEPGHAEPASPERAWPAGCHPAGHA